MFTLKRVRSRRLLTPLELNTRPLAEPPSYAVKEFRRTRKTKRRLLTQPELIDYTVAAPVPEQPPSSFFVKEFKRTRQTTRRLQTVVLDEYTVATPTTHKVSSPVVPFTIREIPRRKRPQPSGIPDILLAVPTAAAPPSEFPPPTFRIAFKRRHLTAIPPPAWVADPSPPGSTTEPVSAWILPKAHRASFRRRLQAVVPVYADPLAPSTALVLDPPPFRRRKGEKTITVNLPWLVLAEPVELRLIRIPALWIANRRHGWRKLRTPTTLDEYTQPPAVPEQPETAFRLPPSFRYSFKRSLKVALPVPEWPLAQSVFPAILLEKALPRFALGRKLQRLPTLSEYGSPATQPESARPVSAWQLPKFFRKSGHIDRARASQRAAELVGIASGAFQPTPDISLYTMGVLSSADVYLLGLKTDAAYTLVGDFSGDVYLMATMDDGVSYNLGLMSDVIYLMGDLL